MIVYIQPNITLMNNKIKYCGYQVSDDDLFSEWRPNEITMGNMKEANTLIDKHEIVLLNILINLACQRGITTQTLIIRAIWSTVVQ